MTDYRTMAREALKRAKREIASDDPDRLAYAALELREIMEALTYCRAESYKDELPVDLYRVWQPREVIRYLTEIDPHGAFASSSLSVGIEEVYGQPAKVMKPLGTEISFTMKDLKTYYDVFGSFLHIPTIAQLQKNKAVDRVSLKQRCDKCIEILEKVLSSPIWNINIGQFTNIECHRCQTNFKWRYNADAEEPLRARCIKCNAIHFLTREGDKLRVEPDWQTVRCPARDCEEEFGIWRDQMQPGKCWKCTCGRAYVGLSLSLHVVDPDQVNIEGEPD